MSSGTWPDPVGAIHALAPSQWQLGHDPIWPDAEIVIPFSRRVTDQTERIAADPVSPRVQGGYTISDTLTELRVINAETGDEVPALSAVWAAGPTGDTSRLHVLARDPFSWMTSYTLAAWTRETEPAIVEQRFGTGSSSSARSVTRWGEVVVDAAASHNAAFIADFTPPLATRVLQAETMTLSFSSVDGKSFDVDLAELVLLDEAKSTVELKHIRKKTRLAELGHGLALWLAALPVRGPTNTIELADEGELLIVAIRYRKARARFKAGARTILTPGSYRLQIRGQSTALPPDLPAPNNPVPAAQPTQWALDQPFDVVQPDTIRPYLLWASIGDSRLFRQTADWNPTPYGIGFPAYRGHLFTLRLATPDTGRIFDPLHVRITDAHDGSLILDGPLNLTANPERTSTATRAAISWAEAHGAPIQPDDEATSPHELPPAPAADSAPTAQAVEVEIHSVDDSTAPPTDRKLDHWQANLSRYATFADQLNYPDRTVTTIDASGRQSPSSCAQFFPVPLPPAPAGRYPTELTTPPPVWLLPEPLNTLARTGLTRGSTTAFLQFAKLSGCRFNDQPTLPALAGVTALPHATTVEALTDPLGRIAALWLRTPEPVDWRRVTAALRVHHVNPESGCPTAFATRRPLLLDGELLPSPDATSAFCVSALRGQPMFTPRGIIGLELSFALTGNADYAFLRRADGAATERQTLVLINPANNAWPLPTDSPYIPRHP